MLTGWDDFFTAQVGASAALAGLLFVGVSLNMAKIVAYPGQANRALQALITLVSILLVSSLFLVPGQSIQLLGVETLVVGSATWISKTYLGSRYLKVVEKKYHYLYIPELAIGEVAALLYLFAGVAMLATAPFGVYLIVPAVLVSFIIAIWDAWVLLVEINR